jgi:Tol biopolymer transport system component
VPASRWSGGKTVGVVAVVAAIGTAAVASSIRHALDGQHPPRAAPTQPEPFAVWTSAEPMRLSRTDELPSTGTPTVDYIIDLDTGEMTPLPRAILETVATTKQGLPRYAASRDGASLAFVGNAENGTRQIFVAGIDGSGIRQVTLGYSDVMSPAWSPDAAKIAYVGYRNDCDYTLFVLDVGTGESSQITGVGRLSRWTQPQFTPDGAALLYSGRELAVRTVPLDGGESTVLIGPRQGLEVGDGALSSDGSLVTMMGNEVGGPGAIRFVTKVDGTGKRSMSLGGSNPAGTWSPAGHRIVCTDFSGRQVIVLDLDTGEASRVARGSAAIWLDDHTLLVEV